VVIDFRKKGGEKGGEKGLWENQVQEYNQIIYFSF
jgi:hypothetical protein